MFKIRSVNVLLALNSRAMNQEELDILCWPSGCEYQQIQFNFALLRSFWYIFPHSHGCYASSEQNHNQPATNLNWAKVDTFQACEIFLFRCSCSLGMQHPKHCSCILGLDIKGMPKTCTRSPVETHFLIFFFLQKSKCKRTPSRPNSLS